MTCNSRERGGAATCLHADDAQSWLLARQCSARRLNERTAVNKILCCVFWFALRKRKHSRLRGGGVTMRGHGTGQRNGRDLRTRRGGPESYLLSKCALAVEQALLRGILYLCGGRAWRWRARRQQRAGATDSRRLLERLLGECAQLSLSDNSCDWNGKWRR